MWNYKNLDSIFGIFSFKMIFFSKNFLIMKSNTNILSVLWNLFEWLYMKNIEVKNDCWSNILWNIEKHTKSYLLGCFAISLICYYFAGSFCCCGCAAIFDFNCAFFKVSILILWRNFLQLSHSVVPHDGHERPSPFLISDLFNKLINRSK